MADRITTYTEGESKNKKLLWFILGLLLGLLLDGLVASRLLADDNNSSSNSASSSSDRQSGSSEDSLLASDQSSAVQTDVIKFGQLLVEASREGVDVPSDEATAAKESLDNATNNLAASIGANDAVKNDLAAVNNAFIAYAGTARNGDDHAAVDAAVNKLSQSLQQQYAIEDIESFENKLTSVKNTVLEGIRNFVANDYKGSYAKQLQAENEIAELFGLLKEK